MFEGPASPVLGGGRSPERVRKDSPAMERSHVSRLGKQTGSWGSHGVHCFPRSWPVKLKMRGSFQEEPRHGRAKSPPELRALRSRRPGRTAGRGPHRHRRSPGGREGPAQRQGRAGASWLRASPSALSGRDEEFHFGGSINMLFPFQGQGWEARSFLPEHSLFSYKECLEQSVL